MNFMLTGLIPENAQALDRLALAIGWASKQGLASAFSPFGASRSR